MYKDSYIVLENWELFEKVERSAYASKKPRQDAAARLGMEDL